MGAGPRQVRVGDGLPVSVPRRWEGSARNPDEKPGLWYETSEQPSYAGVRRACGLGEVFRRKNGVERGVEPLKKRRRGV